MKKLVAIAALLAVGCLKPRDPATQLQDGKALYSCVSAHWGEPISQIAASCANNAVQVVEDVIADLEALFSKMRAKGACAEK